MALIVFIFLKFAGRIDSPYDGYMVCLLLAGVEQLAFRWWLWRRGS